MEEKSIVAIRPKPAFQPLFDIATTREGTDVVSIKEPPQTDSEPEAADSCSWWRRGRVETSPLVSDAIRAIASGLVQLADALEAGGNVVPVELDQIVGLRR